MIFIVISIHTVESLFFDKKGGRNNVGLSGGKQLFVLRTGSFGKLSNMKKCNSTFLLQISFTHELSPGHEHIEL